MNRLSLLLPILAVSGCFKGGDTTLPEELQTPSGSVEIVASTSGTNPDPDGYQLTIDESMSEPVDANGSRTFTGLRPGSYQVTMSEVAPNCAIQGPTTQGFTIISANTTSLTYVVACT